MKCPGCGSAIEIPAPAAEQAAESDYGLADLLDEDLVGGPAISGGSGPLGASDPFAKKKPLRSAASGAAPKKKTQVKLPDGLALLAKHADALVALATPGLVVFLWVMAYLAPSTQKFALVAIVSLLTLVSFAAFGGSIVLWIMASVSGTGSKKKNRRGDQLKHWAGLATVTWLVAVALFAANESVFHFLTGGNAANLGKSNSAPTSSEDIGSGDFTPDPEVAPKPSVVPRPSIPVVTPHPNELPDRPAVVKKPSTPFVGWSLKIGPGEPAAQPLCKTPIALAGSVQHVAFSSPQTAQAVLLLVGKRKSRSRADRLVHLDLATCKSLGEVELQQAATLWDLSPDGQLVALQVAGKEIEVWSSPAGKKVAAMQLDKQMAWAGFVDNDHLATVSGKSGIVQVWKLPQATAVVTTKCGSATPACLSPDRNYLVVAGKDRYQFLDPLTGKVQGDLRVPAGVSPLQLSMNGFEDDRPPPQHVVQMAFSADATRMAALAGNHRESWLLIWDLADGELIGEIVVGPGPILMPMSLEYVTLHWCGPQQFLVAKKSPFFERIDEDIDIDDGNAYLVDAQRKEMVHQYELEYGYVVGAGPDDRLWLISAESSEPFPKRCFLAAHRLKIDAAMSQPPGATDSFGNPRLGETVLEVPKLVGITPASGLAGTRQRPDKGVREFMDDFPDFPGSPDFPGFPGRSKRGSLQGPDTEQDSLEEMRDAHVDLIVGDPAALQKRLQWFPGAKRPTIGLRWGLGMQATGSTRSMTIASVQSMANVTGPTGPTLFNELEQRLGEDKFGDWSRADGPRFGQVDFLGVATQNNLLAAARRRGLSALALFDMNFRPKGLSKKLELQMIVRLIDVATGESLWDSKPLTSTQVAAGERTGRDRGGELLKEVLAEVDAKFAMAPMPTLKPEHARRRVEGFASAGAASGPYSLLALLVELRYYQTKGLLTAEEASPHYDRILGSGNGQPLATGDEAQRRAAVEGWLDGL